MGKRGPKPKPTSLKVFEGNPGKRPLNGAEPKPPKGVSAPGGMGDSALKVWEEDAPMLEALGLLTQADRRQFANYCKLVSLADSLWAEGEYVQWQQAIDKVRKFGNDFGLSPASRVGLKVDGKANDVDELDEFKRSG